VTPFFPPPEAESTRLFRPEPEWRAPRRGEIPVTVAVNLGFAVGEKSALSLAAVKAHTNGLVIELAALSAPRDRRRLMPRSQPRFGVKWTDDTKIFESNGHDDEAEPLGACLTSVDGYGQNEIAFREYWLWPLPPEGAVALVVDWPDQGIPETAIDLATQPVRAAARQVAPSWA